MATRSAYQAEETQGGTVSDLDKLKAVLYDQGAAYERTKQMTAFPLLNQRLGPQALTVAYVRALADGFSNLSPIKLHGAAEEDWEAVEAALEALSDALAWIEGPL